MLKPRGAGSHRVRRSHQFDVTLRARQARTTKRGDPSDPPAQAKARYPVKEEAHVVLEKTQPLIRLVKHKVLSDLTVLTLLFYIYPSHSKHRHPLLFLPS